MARRLTPTTLLASAAVALVPSASLAQLPTDPASLYQVICAACHGPGGKGLAADDPRRDSFDPLPSDLTDPLFSSREPRRDWALVVKHGGAPLGRSSQMPSHGEFLDDSQIGGLVDHLKGLAPSGGYPQGELNMLRAHVTIKAFPEDEVLWLGHFEPSSGAAGESMLQNTLYFGKRLGARPQAEVKLVHRAAGASSRIEEIEAGLKVALLFDRNARWLLTAGFETAVSVHPDETAPRAKVYLALARPLGSSFEGQTSLQASRSVPLGAGAEQPAGIGAAAALYYRPTPYRRGLFPGVEVTGSSRLSGELEPNVTVLPQVHARLNRRGHVGLSVGVDVPVAGDAGYDWRASAFVIWELAEGPPWQGW